MKIYGLMLRKDLQALVDERSHTFMLFGSLRASETFSYTGNEAIEVVLEIPESANITVSAKEAADGNKV